MVVVNLLNDGVGGTFGSVSASRTSSVSPYPSRPYPCDGKYQSKRDYCSGQISRRTRWAGGLDGKTAVGATVVLGACMLSSIN